MTVGDTGPLQPHMAPVELAAFARALEGCRVFLEYGSGGSTVFALQRGVPTIVSVESDPAWAERVLQATGGGHPGLTLAVCDLGRVAGWGRPKDHSNFTEFHRYPVLPWKTLRERGLQPDVVLVDGRFRVACFLYSLLCSREGTVFLFDDYVERPQYHVVEEFCPVVRTAGRMAEFQRPASLDMPRLVESFAQYSVITQ